MNAAPPLAPSLVSFDVFGTLVSVREGSYAAFRSILDESGGRDVDVRAFWEHWEHRNIAHYWEKWRPYREICALSLAESFAHFGLRGDARLIERYFDAFSGFALYPDVEASLATLARRARIAVVSNIDDDLLARTRLPGCIELFCTAEKARGYKPDGTLFRYLIAQAGVPLAEMFHAGQSQRTDLVGGKPLGLTIAWINRRGVALDADVPRPDYEFRDVASLVTLLG
jgi:2-haloalkanoic acid dehalogenase type II